MLKIELSGKFDRMYKDLINRNSHLRREITKRVILFKRNPNDSRLCNHALRKRMKGKFAFSITDDIRIVYEWLGKNTVRFLAVGTHNKVYKKA